MNRNRRRFLRSLSRATLVLPFADILALARRQQSKLPGPIEREYHAKAMPAAKGPKSPIQGTPLGVSFVDIVKESGLAVKTIYGGEHKNKYLLETTGCGLAFYDYDNDGWLDVFLVNGWRLEGFPSRTRAALPVVQEQSRRYIHRHHDKLRVWNTKPGGGRPAVSAIMTTMGTTTCSSLTTVRTSSIAITATVRLPT